MAGRVARLGMNVGFGLARLWAETLPLRCQQAMADRAAPLLYTYLAPLRRALLANARRLLGEDSTLARRRRLARQVLANFGRFTVELLNAHRTLPDPDELFSRMTGREHYEAACQAGRGVIGITLHLGHYELGPLLLARIHQPLAIVYTPDPSGVFEAIRSRRRADTGLQEIPIKGPFYGVRVLEVLRAGGMALVAADTGFASGAGRRYPLLGHPAPLHDWPARTAIASGAPLLPCFVLRTSGDSFHVELHPPIFPAGRTPEALMAELIPVLEDVLRRHPEQWLTVHEYWG